MMVAQVNKYRSIMCHYPVFDILYKHTENFTDQKWTKRKR